MNQATLLRAIQAVVSRVEIADKRAGERLAQHALDHVAAAMFVDEEDRQFRIAEAPGPRGLAVDAPTGLVALHDGRVAQAFEQVLDDRFEQRPAPTQMAEQARSAHGEAEEV